jgi:imidazolonepropionase-like amidohydrolase
MRLSRVLRAAVWLLAGLALPATAQGPAAGRGAVAFVDVNVVPMDRNRVLEKQTVIVRDGKIAEMGPSARVQVPDGATRIEASGKYLMPGLAEMHAHLPGPQSSERLVNYILLLYVANGVTTVRGMLGQPNHLELRRRAAANEILGPRIFAAGPAFSGNSARDKATAERMVVEQKEAGYDLLKVHSGLTREVYDAIAAKAKSVGIRFAGHVSQFVGLLRALEVRQASIEHLDSYLPALEKDDSPIRNADPETRARELLKHIDEGMIPALAQATRGAGVWNAPTLYLWQSFTSPETPEQMAERPEMKYATPQWRAAWAQQKRQMMQNARPPEDARRVVEIRNKFVRALRDAGARLLLASDSPQMFNVPGFSLHRELAALTAAGLTPYQALESGTRNPAEFFGSKEFGTVAVGKAADLLLLEANPLADVANVARRAGVMLRGRWLPEPELRRMLDEAATAMQTN